MGGSLRYSTFFLNGICFGVQVEKVQGVLEYQEITPVPLASATLPGIINLRGQILTTIDLKSRLNLTVSEASERPMMMVIRTSTGESCRRPHWSRSRRGRQLVREAHRNTEALHPLCSHARLQTREKPASRADTEKVIQLQDANGEGKPPSLKPEEKASSVMK
jgi:CheW-like domain